MRRERREPLVILPSRIVFSPWRCRDRLSPAQSRRLGRIAPTFRSAHPIEADGMYLDDDPAEVVSCILEGCGADMVISFILHGPPYDAVFCAIVRQAIR